MFQMLKKKVKDQRGFTLIELLAVIVILGIIAAIAVPSILGLIENSKKDAHVANAQQMVSAAKMLVASDSDFQDAGPHYVTLNGLVNMKYLDPVDSPEDPYLTGSDDDMSAPNSAVSYVRIVNGKVTGVHLLTQNRKRTLDLISSDIATPINIKAIKRDLVLPK